MSEKEIIEIDAMSVDQFAGAVVLILGTIGSLLLVIWQSKCHCKVNLCYIFQCERRPPNEDEMKGLKDQAKNKKEEAKNKKEEEKYKDDINNDREFSKKTFSGETPENRDKVPNPNKNDEVAFDNLIPNNSAELKNEIELKKDNP